MLTCNKAVHGNAEGGSVDNQFQPYEPVAAAVQLYVDVLLCVLDVLRCIHHSAVGWVGHETGNSA